MVGATLFFLPDNADAEKKEPLGQQTYQKAAVQANSIEDAEEGLVSVGTSTSKEAMKKSEQTKIPSEKAKIGKSPEEKLEPNSAIRYPSGGKKNSTRLELIHEASHKPITIIHSIPGKANGKIKSALKNTNKNLTKLVDQKEEVKSGLGNNNQETKVIAKHSAQHSFIKKDTEEKKKAALSKQLIKMMESKNNGLKSKKEITSVPLAPISPEQKSTPINKKEIPEISHEVNQTHRTSHSAGPSHDRGGNGVSAISLLDKWFVEWNKFYQNQFLHSYLSRDVWMNSQWVNAPPSPPPQDAPLLENVNRS